MALLPIVNQCTDWCRVCTFQTLENTNAEKTVLKNKAPVEIQPAHCLFSLGRRPFVINATNGKATPIRANLRVRESVAFKKCIQNYFFIETYTHVLTPQQVCCF